MVQEVDGLHPVLERLVEESHRLAAALPLLVLALLVVWLAWGVGGWLSRRKSFLRVSRDNPFLRELARTTTRWVVLLLGVLVALEIMDATAVVGALLGTAGVLGVALGFAFKDILENYLAGILMSMRQMFSPRDHVVIDGNEGIVVAMTSRATILMTLDGNHLRLPNALVFRSVTLNYSRNPSRRFSFDVGIGVNEDLVLAQKLGVDELAQIEGVLETPPPRAFINALGESSVQVTFHGWVDQRSHDFLRVRSEAIRRTKLAMESADMDMPEPIYRVQISEHKDRPPQEARQARAKMAREDASLQPAMDTRADADLSAQIDFDRQVNISEDLLHPGAPRE
jgi:small conductance mechanosensitive channel